MSFKCFQFLRTNMFGALVQRKGLHTSCVLKSVVDGGAGTHKPTPFQRKILLWTKTYKTDADIPSRVTLTQMKNSMDRFRIRVSIAMLAMTFFGAGVMAMIGRKERLEGKSVFQIAMQKRDEDKRNH